jgi:hypothetical protein
MIRNIELTTTFLFCQKWQYRLECTSQNTRRQQSIILSHVRVPWIIITGSGLDDWIYWQLLLQSFVITINYNNSQSIFSRTLLPWMSRTRPILVLILRLTDWLRCTLFYSESKLCYDRRSVDQSVLVQAPIWDLKPDFFSVWELRVCWCGAPFLTRGQSVFYTCHVSMMCVYWFVA